MSVLSSLETSSSPASPSSCLEPHGLWLGLRVLCPVKFQRLMAAVGSNHKTQPSCSFNGKACSRVPSQIWSNRNP